MSNVIYNLTIKEIDFETSVESWAFTSKAGSAPAGSVGVFIKNLSVYSLYLELHLMFREVLITNRFYRNPKRINAMTDSHTLTLFDVSISDYKYMNLSSWVEFDFARKTISRQLSVPELFFSMIQ